MSAVWSCIAFAVVFGSGWYLGRSKLDDPSVVKTQLSFDHSAGWIAVIRVHGHKAERVYPALLSEAEVMAALMGDIRDLLSAGWIG